AFAILTACLTAVWFPTPAGTPPFATPVALPASVPTVTLGQALARVQASNTLSPTSIAQDFDNAYVQSWNLNIQREIGNGLSASVGYFASKGTHLQITRNFNQILPDRTRPFRALSASSAIQPNVLLANITQRENGGNSNYNALWETANKRFSQGAQFNAPYTFSKSSH